MCAAKLFCDLIRDRRGGPATEFGVVITIFLMVVLGVIEIGSYAMTEQALIESVHDGGRYAVVHGSKSAEPATAASLQSLVQSESSVLTSTLVSVTVTFTPNNSPGSTVSIVATYPWTPIVPLAGFSAATITATSISTILN
ncbi:MAG: TadE/TadG family type IV pilus assembly protein [Roseiarcus sp.]|jgi:Flp pilus assembly protein TadG